MKNSKRQPKEDVFENENILDTVFALDTDNGSENNAPEESAVITESENDKFVSEGDDYLNGFVNDTISDALEPPKSPLIIRILRYFFPWKGDAVKEIIRKCIFLIALVAFVISGVYLINYYYTGVSTNNDLEDVRSKYYSDLKSLDDDKNPDGTYKRFNALYKMNEDVIGWVSINDTKIDYPVFQGDDNDFYITHDMYKTENRYGAVFADCDASITAQGNSRNVVLYGHNMIDGSIFTQLLDYKNLDFYREHPVISFDTLYNEAKYKIFAVYIVNADKKDDNGYVFNYRQHSFQTTDAFLSFIEETRARSILDTTEAVTVEVTDEILTLSTCSYEFDNARTVIVARKVRENESGDVSVSNVRKNKNPLYPQAYYDAYGGTKPELNFKPNNNIEDEKSELLHEVINLFKGENDEVYTTDDIISTEELEAMGEVEYVTLGNYVGLSLGEAIGRTNELGINLDIEYDGDNEINKNEVLSQSLTEGTSILKGSTITLKVTGVPIEITIPDFVGKSLSQAKKEASENGLTVCTVTVASKQKKNTVLMQSVAPGTKTENRTITLYISNGINKIPNVVGLSVKKAKALLKEEGFKYEVKYHATINKDQIGKVASQSISAGETKKLGTLVTIYAGKKSSGETVDDQPYIEQEPSGNTSSNSTSSTNKDKNSSSSKGSSTTSSSKLNSASSIESSVSEMPSSSVTSSNEAPSSSEVPSSSPSSSEMDEPTESAPESTPENTENTTSEVSSSNNE